MREMKDTVSKLFIKAIDILFIYNVTGTSYGIILGVFLLSLKEALSLVCPTFGLIKWYGYIAFGVIIFNIKPMIKQTYINPRVESILKYTRELIKEGNFSEKEKKRIWHETIESISKEILENHDDANNSNNINDDALA